MDERSIDSTLAACERDLARDATPDLRETGFWRAVAAVKRRPALVATYADRIARIDRGTFARKVRLRAPAPLGVAALVVGLAFGIAALLGASAFDPPLREIVLLIGFGALDVTTHGLAHFLVGAAVGIHFTDWFVDLPKRPQPGLKVDYASYLRTPARSRAWMHASGAIATKLTPFLVVAYAIATGVDGWAIGLVLAVGILQIVSDVLFSVRASDWKKFRREMRLARR